MLRNLKILLAAAAALTALGAIGASGAQAAEFHCAVEPCRYTLKPDGTGKTAHQVMILENQSTSESVSFTCPTLSGEGTSNASTASELTLTNLAYQGECKGAGSISFEWSMNGCDYHLTASGQMTITCPEGEVIETQSATGCVYTIGPQGPLNGVSYHTIGTSPNREITMSMDIHGITMEALGTKAECLIDPDQDLELTYTTGNTILTAETHAGEMVDGWWE